MTDASGEGASDEDVVEAADDDGESRRDRLKGRLSKAVDVSKEGARAGWSVTESGVGAAVRAGKTAVEAGTDQAQRVGDVAKDVIDRVRDSDDNAEFLPLWPAASEHGEHDVSVKVLAEDTADAMTEDMLTIATLVLGGAMAELTWDDDQDASNRIRTAIEPRILSLNDAVNDGEPFNPETVLSELGKELDPERATAALLDLWFIDPFAPYEIGISRKVRRGAIDRVAESLGVDEQQVESIKDTIDEARTAHRTGTIKRMALFGVGGVLLIGAAGFLAAPAIATAIGTSAGLSGAAATSYGMALLGGGSLAAGGAGMTGGLWLVSGVGGALGLVGGAGGRAMYELGVNQLRIEVVKLQVSYKFMLLDQQIDTAKAHTVIVSMRQRIEELSEQIDVEKTINDKNSDRVNDLEEKLVTLMSGLEWMKDLELAA